MNKENTNTFIKLLAYEYVDLFNSDPEYAYSAAHITPIGLATKMTLGLATGGANKDGKAIRRTCQKLGIKHTYKAIHEYLTK